MKESCRFCTKELTHTFCNLGKTPLSNSYLTESQLQNSEISFPLHAFVCDSCFLVQLEEFEKPEAIFSDYSYFSSYSDTWLEHAKKFTEQMINRFKLSAKNQVVEIASNDGYLLQYFHNKKIPTLGIEPAKNVAAVAASKGITTLTEFFGTKLAADLAKKNLFADLLIANNVLAHVPDLNDFVKGMQMILAKEGVATIEFPHLLHLIQQNQFDTIYHEHFSYFSFSTVEKIVKHHNLDLFDVDSLPTHGGSLRIYACHAGKRAVSENVHKMKVLERDFGLLDLDTYFSFAAKTISIRENLLKLLKSLKTAGKKVVAYGAPAKGNTLLNFCAIGKDLIAYTVDRSPHKQDKFLPGSQIPIFSPEKISITKPDFILILPWNLKEEIMSQLAYVRDWKAKFIIPIPEPQIVS